MLYKATIWWTYWGGGKEYMREYRAKKKLEEESKRKANSEKLKIMRLRGDIVGFYYTEEMAIERDGSARNAGFYQGIVVETKPKERIAKVMFTHVGEIKRGQHLPHK